MQYYLINPTERVAEQDNLNILQNCKQFKNNLKMVLKTVHNNVIQIAVVTTRIINNCKITATNLESEYKTLENSVSVFNCQGFDNYGKPYTKTKNFLPNDLNVLYIGINLQDAKDNEIYKSHIDIDGFYGFDLEILAKDDIANTEYPNLHFINSRRFINFDVAKGYKPLEVEKNTIKILGRDVEIAESGLIGNVKSYFTQSLKLCEDIKTNLFSKPMQLDISNNILKFRQDKIVTDGYKANIKAKGKNENVSAEIIGEIFYDGYFKYSIKITAIKDSIFDNISLNSTFAENKYSMGFGKQGGYFTDIDYKWLNTKNDSIFIGNTNAGMKIKFTESDSFQLEDDGCKYYKSKIPQNWDNQQKGGIKATKNNGIVSLNAYLGSFVLPKKANILLTFEGNITPFKPFNIKEHFKTKIVHVKEMKGETAILNEAMDNKLSHINLLYGNIYNPFVNAPNYCDAELKEFIKTAHKKNLKTNLYYTIKDLSAQAPEVFAYNAFGDEIFERKNKIQDNHNLNDLIITRSEKINSGKYKGKIGESYALKANTRFNNYYVEMVNHLINYVGVDGLYIDDSIMNRITAERTRKCLQEGNMIDFRIYNSHNNVNTSEGALLRQMEILPFVDSLWLGQDFDIKDCNEDYILTEMSGLLFGNGAKVLQNNEKNYHLSMLYGMFENFGLSDKKEEIKALYKLIDKEKLATSKFYGYWDEDVPVTCNNENIKISCYIKEDKRIFVTIYNFSNKKESFDIGVNVKSIGFETHDKTKKKIKIKNIQSSKKLNINEKLTIKGKSGYFMVIK